MRVLVEQPLGLPGSANKRNTSLLNLLFIKTIKCAKWVSLVTAKSKVSELVKKGSLKTVYDILKKYLRFVVFWTLI